MVCYGPRLGVMAASGIIAYALWHKAIINALHIVALAMQIALITAVAISAAVAVAWAVRAAARRRAAAGACAGCRFGCQLALTPAPRPRPRPRRGPGGRHAAAPRPVIAAIRRRSAGDLPAATPAPSGRTTTARHTATAGQPPPIAEPAGAPDEVVIYHGYLLTPEGVAGETSRAASP
jgi:hypothetical protein